MASNTDLFIVCFNRCLSYDDYISELQQYKQVNVNQILIQYNKDLKVNPLWMAVFKNKINLVRFLVEKCNAKVNKYIFLGFIETDNPLKNSSPLFVATYLGYYEIAKYLVKCGANINKPNGIGTTPFMESVRNEQFCQYLITKNINLNLRDSKGLTALDYAINHKSFNTAILLLRNGANSFINDFMVDVSFHLINKNDNHHSSDEMKINILKTIGEMYHPLDKESIANAWELLSVGVFNLNLKIRCLEKAIEIRESENIIKRILPYNDFYSHEANYRHAEFISIIGEENKEFENHLLLDVLNLKIQEAFICERIIPSNGTIFIRKLISLSELFDDEEKKLHLLCYALKYCSMNKDNATLTTLVLEKYLSLFSHSNSHYKFLSHLMGKLYGNEFKYVDKSNYLLVFYFFLDILYLFLNNDSDKIYVITLLMRKQKKQMETRDSLLHIIVSYEFKHHIKSFLGIYDSFHLRSTLLKFLVLDCGFDINHKNNSDSTPLIIVAKNFETNLIKLLIVELKAHVDMHPSCYNFIVKEKERYFSNEIYQIVYNNMTLKCLSAQIIKKYRIPYKNFLCPILKNFIDVH